MTTITATVNMNKEEEATIIIKKKISKPTRKAQHPGFTKNPGFTKQVYRQDILENMLNFMCLTGTALYELVMTDNHTSSDESRQGDLFESLCEILTLLKCFTRINYAEMLEGQLTALKLVTKCEKILGHKVHQGGNVSDITIKDTTGAIIAFSSKHKKNISKKGTDLNDLDATLKKTGLKYKLGLFVKDKSEISKSKKNDIHKQIYDEVEANNLIFDNQDVIQALEVFRSRFTTNVLPITDFIEFVNAEYLLSPRMQLVYKLHQMVTFHNFVTQYALKNLDLFCIKHKPRSGKSITILLTCKYLLAQGVYPILITTAVPSTITNFTADINNYIDFKGINYKGQDDFALVSKDFVGIVFCSVEYLKIDGKHTKKADILKKIGFDVIVIDEAHLGGSTDKTKSEIIYIDPLIEDIRKNIKISIFASGTADKIIKNYNIPLRGISEWELEDEGHMKLLGKPSISTEKREEILTYMTTRHGQVFMKCYQDVTLNKDYSKHPTQVLMKHAVEPLLVKDINEYNKKYGTNFGLSYSSLFALKQQRKAEPERHNNGEIIKTKEGDDYYTYEYADKFALEESEDGKDILKWVFENIISEKNRNKITIMKDIEKTQSERGSRQSSVENPQLFIVYMPIHTGNNNIAQLQKTSKRFIEEHRLWPSYNIEFSNATNTSGNVKEKEYNDEIKNMMDKTKQEGKRACMLFLGNKGSVGITYHECDVTISLDDGHNLDNQKQRYSRALTEAQGKTIGINVDMNIQRTYLILMDTIHKYRKNTNTTKTNAEILYYLYEQNIFLFNPQHFNNGKTTTAEIKSYFQVEAENILKEIDDTALLENIVCEDAMHEYLLKMVVKNKTIQKQINTDLEGDQQDCPKGEKSKYEVDAPLMSNDTQINETEEKEEEEKLIEKFNKTLELCKWLFPYLALISRAYKIVDFKTILTNELTQPFIISFFNYKKIDFNSAYKYNDIVDIMATIIDNNAEIISNIREIYNMAPSHKLRELIAKHFVPTEEEKKGAAEVPTPVKLVDEMLDLIPVEFWKKPQQIFEPCCGKGNFVLGIFERFNKGLVELYPDNEERCRIIMTECIYYAELSGLNVFITTEIMKCEVESVCGIMPEYDFNSNIGNTLELNVLTKWDIAGFNAVIGNPPYNDDSGNKGKGHILWPIFIENSLTKWLNPNGYLLFVNPSLWRQPEHPLQALMKSKQIIYLEIHDEKDGLKTFKCNTRYDIYLIQNKKYDIPTRIKTQKKELEIVDLREWNFIPNYNFDIVGKIINGKEKVDILESRSAYGHDKKHVNKSNDSNFIFPVVYSVNRDNVSTFHYSSINTNGHFKIPKVIFGSGATGFLVDSDGKYGLTQWAVGIADDVENLENIRQALNSSKFKDIILATSVSKAEINRKILKYFKKDFWKEFV